MNKPDIEGKVFDEILKYTAEKHVELIADQYSDIDIDIDIDDMEFSDRHKKNMDSFFAARKKKQNINTFRKYAIRAAIFLLVIVIVFSISVMSVEAWRHEVFQLFQKSDSKSTSIAFEKNPINYSQFIDHSGGMILPRYITNGYEPSEYIKISETEFTFIYNNVNGNSIVLEKYLYDRTIDINNENVVITDLTIMNKPAKFFSSNNKNHENVLLFEHKGYIYTLIACEPQEEIIKIAESMN